jgi:hypothetical protein
LYIEFETGQVGLDYSVMEAPYSRLKQVPPPSRCWDLGLMVDGPESR